MLTLNSFILMDNLMHKHIKLILVVLIVTIANSYIYAQKAETDSTENIKTDILYFKSESLFKCNIKLPDNYDPQKNYKLVIGLPVAFYDFRSIWNDFDIDFIYAIPQAQYSTLMDNKMLSDWAFWTSYDSSTIDRAANLTADYMGDLVSELKAHYNIDDIYLMGFSQSAIFTYIAGLQRPRLYKGIICLSGPAILEPLRNPFAGEYAPDWLEEKYLEPAKTLRVFIAHGTKDQTPPFDYGVKSKEVLTSYGYDVTFHSFDGGHTIDSKILKLALEWINK